MHFDFAKEPLSRPECALNDSPLSKGGSDESRFAVRSVCEMSIRVETIIMPDRVCIALFQDFSFNFHGDREEDDESLNTWATLGSAGRTG